MGLPFRERIKAEVDMALQGVRDLHRKTWVNALNRARWASWPLPVQRLVSRGPANWSRPLDAAARAGLTRHCRTVWIDAWKYESGAALWAAFTKEIYRQAQKQTGGWSARLKFRLALANGVDPTESGYSWGWVFWKVALSYLKERWTVLAAAGTGVGLGIATWQVLDPSEAVLIGGGGLAGLAGLVKGLFRQPFSFNLGKASAAAANRPEPVDSVGAPDDIARMIRLLAHRKDEAMVVFVDDLDRCSPDKVKEAVEAINLLFNGTERAQTVFILGMDVDLVSASMQVAYRPMVAELRRVENSSASDFGYRFLSKIVQLSLNIPTPAPSAMENYLGGLIGTEVPRNGDAPTPIPAAAPAAPRTPESDAERTGRIKQDAKKVISGLRSNEARSNAGDQAVVEDRPPEERDEFVEELRKVIQQENLRGLTGDSPEVQKAIQDGSRTLPPRPRDYKRFVNAVRLQLLVANQSLKLGTPERATNEQIAKWTALGMRWPNLAAELRARPEILGELEAWAKKSYDKVQNVDGVDRWKEKPEWDDITEQAIHDNAWSRRMRELTADPDLGPALREDPLLGKANLHGLLSVH